MPNRSAVDSNLNNKLVELADQIVATWPDEYLVPNPADALGYMSKLKVSLGVDLDMDSEAKAAVFEILNLIGHKEFRNRIIEVLSKARNKVVEAKGSEILNRVEQKIREIEIQKRIEYEAKLAEVRKLEIQKRIDQEKKLAEIRELEKLKEEAKLQLLKDFKADLEIWFDNSYLSADQLFEEKYSNQNFLFEYQESKISFLRNWFAAKYAKDVVNADSLDDEQILAIGSGRGNFQVVARAGSGKTTVTVLRTIFLIQHCGIKPEEIMLLAFNRDASLEIKRRLLFLLNPTAKKLFEIAKKDFASKSVTIKDKVLEIDSRSIDSVATQLKINLPFVLTFHALARSIVQPIGQILYDDAIDADMAQSRVIQEIVDEALKDPAKLKSMRELMVNHFKEDYDVIIASTYGMSGDQLLQLRRSLPYETIDGKFRKSYGEKLISDFLFDHSVDYHYERNHWWGSLNYRPDFTIINPSGQGLIIEYFGMRDEDYKQQIIEKRKFWSTQKSWKLVEIYPEDVSQGFVELQRKLVSELNTAGIEHKKLTDEEIWELISSDVILKYSTSIKDFITRCKQIGWSSKDLSERIATHKALNDAEALYLKQVHYFFGAYESSLDSLGDTDFAQILQDSVRLIKQSNTTFHRKSGSGDLKNLKFLFVDEFQDFSFFFSEILNAVVECNPEVSLFCVGDDWQAINSFAGSDLQYFDNFLESFPNSKQIHITTNYRSDGHIVDAGNSVMAGHGVPAKKSKPNLNKPKVGFLLDFEPSLHEHNRHENDLITPAILRLINSQIQAGNDVVILSRTNTIPYYLNSSESGFLGNKLVTFLEHIRSYFPEDISRRISISTTHKYKGRERQAVILIDASARRYPHIHPLWVFSRILGSDLDSIEEDDRRLFYVAVTRAINQLFVISESKETLTSYLENAAPQQLKLNWSDFEAPVGKSGSIVIQIENIKTNNGNTGGTFAIKDLLKINRFVWSSSRRVWHKSAPRELFDVEELQKESWAQFEGIHGLRVSIYREPHGELARYEIRDGKWICNFDNYHYLN